MSRPLWLSLCLLACAEPDVDPTASPLGGVRSGGAQGLHSPPLWGAGIVTLGPVLAVSDTEGDAVHLVQRSASGVISSKTLSLGQGSRPTRLADAGHAQVVVLLRGAAQAALVDVRSESIVWREDVCAEPRGITWDAVAQAATVACGNGEVLTVSPTQRSRLEVGEELRDPLWVNGRLWVTTFRSAQLLELDPEGTVVTRLSPPTVPGPRGGTFVPHVAWRTVTDGHVIVMSHQLHDSDDVSQLTGGSPVYYGDGSCLGSVVVSAVTVFDPVKHAVIGGGTHDGALPVDVALAGGDLAVANAASGTYRVAPLSALDATYSCLYGPSGASGPPPPSGNPSPTAIGWFPDHTLAVLDSSGDFAATDLLRFTFDDHRLRTTTSLGAARQLFHAVSPSGVACASCHAEGYDDGHVWNFAGKIVRTPSLEGGLLATAPYHWQGELPDLRALLAETFELRMGGRTLDAWEPANLGKWLNGLPARAGGPAVPEGERYFELDGCAGCHLGSALTNGATVDVGTGGAFQVPSLRAVSWRGPWLHDGCAKTLAQRFSPDCHGDTHAPVPPEHVAALVAYLKSL